MADILAEILDHKRDEVAERKAKTPLSALERALPASPPRGFLAALRAARAAGRPGLICEVKKASPSKGLIRADFDPATLARAYQAGGATCLSVLTDRRYFQGDDQDLAAARLAVSLPVIRKDFMVDPYQIVESRVLGADCILLILAGLEQKLADQLEGVALDLGMDVLIETHDATEVERALGMRSRLIGINNRNLKTMQVDLDTTIALAPWIGGDHFLVGESGIATAGDLEKLAGVGVSGFLVGESLMRQADVETATRQLLGYAA